MISWFESFMIDRHTTLMFEREKSKKLNIKADISQESFLSLILFLFYNFELVDLCNDLNYSASEIEFVDDVNLLVYSFFTRWNCQILSELHDKCLEWANRHEVDFASQKYELIHLFRTRKKFDMKINIQLSNLIKHSIAKIRVLRLWLDFKLRWDEHKKEILVKMKTQTNALERITNSTWDLSLLQTKRVYTAVIRSSLTHAATVWHVSEEIEKNDSFSLIVKFERIENKALRSVTDVYKATSIITLQTKTSISSLDLWLNERLIRQVKRLHDSRISHIIENACAKIQHKLRSRNHRKQIHKVLHLESREAKWYIKWTIASKFQSTRRIFKKLIFKQQTVKREIRRRWHHRWRQRNQLWKELSFFFSHNAVAKLHKNLKREQNFIVTQIRIEKNDLRVFLHKRNVLDFNSSNCDCDRDWEIADHVMLHCVRYSHSKNKFKMNESNTLRKLTIINSELRLIINWWLKNDILSQFELTHKLQQIS